MTKFFGSLMLIFTLNFISSNALVLPKNVEIKFLTKDQLEELLKKDTNIVELSKNVQRLEDKESDAIEPRYTIEYYVGRREAYDYLVARDSTAFSWPEPRDVLMSIDYPATPGTGRIVTYVNILVNQNFTSGRAYVTDGGIGYRYITIVVEAEYTNYFDFEVNIYGRD